MAERTVNPRQREVLDWIVAGCPPRDWPNASYKTTAVALQGRRLVLVSKRGGSWRAEATVAGRHYSEHGTYPDGHWMTRRAPSTAPATTGSDGTVPVPMPRFRRESPTGRGAATELLADLQGADGTLDIRPDQRDHYIKVARTLRAAKGLLPDGKTVSVTQHHVQPRVLLIDAPSPPEPLTPIRVPRRLPSKPHPAVLALRDTAALNRLSKHLRTRVMRCTEALAREAELRGYKVTATTGGIQIDVRGHAHSVEFKEPQDRTDHVPTAHELAYDAKWSWRTYPRYDYKPSGRLRITSAGGEITDAKPRADGTITRVVEDRLAEVLQNIENSVAHAEQWKRRQEEAAAQRRSRWEQVRAQAIVEYADHYRGQALLSQAARYAETRSIDDYLAALDAHVQALTDHEECSAAEEWRAWAHRYRATRDPFATPPAMPTVPEPGRDDLAPFMQGLNAWGPS